MEDRAVPVWRLQTAEIKTGSPFCICEEQLEVKGGCGARSCPQDEQGSDKTAACDVHPAQNKQRGDQVIICSSRSTTSINERNH